MNKELFDSLREANVRADALEAEGFEYVSIVANVDGRGRAEVKYGSLPSVGADRSVLADYNRIFDAKEKLREEKFTADCWREGRAIVAVEAAAAKGYTGRDAEVFAEGFCGVPAKRADPRAEGREMISREGRAEYGKAEVQRAIRVASEKARSTLERPAPFHYSEGAISNGEQ